MIRGLREEKPMESRGVLNRRCIMKKKWQGEWEVW